MSITTKKGDNGTTATFPTGTQSKTSHRIEALAHLDNLQANIGVLVANLWTFNKEWHKCFKGTISDNLVYMITHTFQAQTLTIQAAMTVVSCVDPVSERVLSKLRKIFDPANPRHIKGLENLIHSTEKTLGKPKYFRFFVPGADVISSQINLCRTECRIAEHYLWCYRDSREFQIDFCKNVGIYLNRLSDLFFIMTRYFYEFLLPMYYNKVAEVEKKKPSHTCKKHKSVSPHVLRFESFIENLEKHVIHKTISSWDYSEEYPANVYCQVRRISEFFSHLHHALAKNLLGRFHITWLYGAGDREFELAVLDIESNPTNSYRIQFNFKPTCILLRAFKRNPMKETVDYYEECVLSKKFPFKRRRKRVPLTC